MVLDLVLEFLLGEVGFHFLGEIDDLDGIFEILEYEMGGLSFVKFAWGKEGDK